MNRQPEIDQRCELFRHLVNRLLVADTAVEPALGGVSEYRSSDRKAADRRGSPSDGEALFQRLDRGIEAEQHDAAAVRIARGDDVVDRPPGRGGRLRFKLPPVGLEAGVVKLGERARDRVVRHGAGLRSDNLDQDLAADLARGVEGGAELRDLLAL